MKIEVSAGFILLAALVYFFDMEGLTAVFLPAVAAHELGHVLAIRMLGGRTVLLEFTSAGLKMDYAGYLSPRGELLCAVAGPAFGIALAFGASVLGRFFGSEYLLCMSGVSIILSLFNLLPASPLDGGMILSILLKAEIREAVLFVTTLLTAALLIAVGLFTASRGLGAATIPAGIWLLALMSGRDKPPNR